MPTDALAARPQPKDWIAEPPPKGKGLYLVRGGLSPRARRIYVDNSVISGCLDAEFMDASNALLEAARQGSAIIVVSNVVQGELAPAPPGVRAMLQGMLDGSVERVLETRESRRLAETYIREGVLTQKSENDAKHIAIAAVSRVDALVSWNRRHIANPHRARRYNAINQRLGYPALVVHKPTEELLHHGKEL